jgi:hypothetical protein
VIFEAIKQTFGAKDNRKLRNLLLSTKNHNSAEINRSGTNVLGVALMRTRAYYDENFWHYAAPGVPDGGTTAGREGAGEASARKRL